MKAREPVIRVDSKVLIQLKKHRNDTPAWDIQPYTVTSINGSMITAARHNHVTTRNSSFFKLYRDVENEESETEATNNKDKQASEGGVEADPENAASSQ